jgi:hypothetical protein
MILKSLWIATLALLTVTVCRGSLLADVYIFTLKNGGRIEGEWVNREDTLAREAVVKTPEGEVVLSKSSIAKHTFVRPAMIEYERRAAKSPDTVEAHLALAEWCRVNFLSDRGKLHLERVIELSPDHAEARRKLGQRLVDGQWMTREEEQKRKGMVRYKGKWVLPQEVELLNRKEEIEQAEKDWFKRLRQWKEMADSINGDKSEAGKSQIAAIRDPHAIKALLKFYENERNLDLRLLFIKVLGGIDRIESLSSLVKFSLLDKNEDIRLACWETLAKYRGDNRLKLTNLYVAALKSKENEEIQRAAIGIRYVPHPGAVGPLIDSLITEHVYTIAPQGASGAGSINSTFDKSGRGGNGMGGGLSVNSQPKRVRKTIMNQEVLGTLVQLSGVDHGFDEKAWKRWYTAQRKDESLDARRN